MFSGRNGLGIHFGGAFLQIRIAGEFFHRGFGVVGVAQIIGTVGKHALFNFGYQVHVLGRIEWYTFEIVGAVFFHRQQLAQGNAARAGQWCGVYHIVTPFKAHRFAPFDLVFVQIFGADQAAIALHLSHQQFGRFAAVKFICAILRDAAQGFGQFGLFEIHTCFQIAKILGEIGFAVVHFFHIGAVERLCVCHHKAVFGIADGRLHHFGPFEFAKFFVRFPQAQYRTRHACGFGTDHAHVFDDFAFFIQIHVFGGGFGCDFAVVDEVGFAIHVYRHETTAADVACFRIGHRQGKRSGHGRIHGIAAFFEDVFHHFGAVAIGHGISGFLGIG